MLWIFHTDKTGVESCIELVGAIQLCYRFYQLFEFWYSWIMLSNFGVISFLHKLDVDSFFLNWRRERSVPVHEMFLGTYACLIEENGLVLTYLIHDSCVTAFSWPHTKLRKVVKCSRECCDITHLMKTMLCSDSCLCIDNLCLTAVNRSPKVHVGIPMMSGKYIKYWILCW